MENEQNIFVAWLIKFIKIDKAMTGKELAGKIGLDPTTISSYTRGRTKPHYNTRLAILKATGIGYEDMLEVGRKELNRERLHKKFEQEQAADDQAYQAHLAQQEKEYYEANPKAAAMYEHDRRQGQASMEYDAYQAVLDTLREYGCNLSPEESSALSKIVLKTTIEDKPEDNIVVLKHQELVKDFKYKDEGLAANQALLKIEDLDIDVFFQSVAELKSKAIKLQIAKEKAEQEVKEGPDTQEDQKKKANGTN